MVDVDTLVRYCPLVSQAFISHIHKYLHDTRNDVTVDDALDFIRYCLDNPNIREMLLPNCPSPSLQFEPGYPHDLRLSPFACFEQAETAIELLHTMLRNDVHAYLTYVQYTGWIVYAHIEDFDSALDLCIDFGLVQTGHSMFKRTVSNDK